MHSNTTLVGRVGRDPELRYLPDGTAVANVSLAEQRGFGERKTTVWWRVAVWRNTAETAAKWVHKGDIVLFEGKVQEPRVYTNKQGQQVASLELSASYMRIVQSTRSDEQAPDDAQGEQQARPAPQQATKPAVAQQQAFKPNPATLAELDALDEIPF